jgi:4-amino-4-deoxy-L-arabinose transferase-like glycosyltransferase
MRATFAEKVGGAWVVPVIVGALARIGVWALGVSQQTYLSRDTQGYWSLSEDLLSAYDGTNPALLETALLRPPGYPAILFLFRTVGDSYTTAALLQSLIGVGAVFLTYHLALRLAGVSVATVAAWWVAVDPLLVVQSSVLLTETIFAVLMLVALAHLTPLAQTAGNLAPWRWATAGLLVAAATFVRPISLYLPILVIVVGLFVALVHDRRRLIYGTLVFLIAFALPVGAWFVHNSSLTGVPTFSTVQGVNLALYRAVGAMIHEEGVSRDEARSEMRRLVEAETTPEMNPAEMAAIETRVGIQEILKRPRGYVISAARGSIYTLFGPGQADIQERLSTGRWAAIASPVVVLSIVSALGMALFATAGVWHLTRGRAWAPLLLLGLPIVYLLLIGSGQESEARFRVPLAPMIAILAAVGVTWLVDLRKEE